VSRDDLLDAAEALIRDRGWANTTLAEMALAASVSLEECETHFADRDTLLRALNDRHVVRVIATIDESTRSGIWSTTSTAEVIEVAVRSILDAIIDNEQLMRAFLTQSAVDPAWTTDVHLTGEYLTERVLAVLADRKDLPPSSEGRLAFGLYLTASLAYHVVLGRRGPGAALSREELADRQTRVVLAYLGLPAA
jgi:AcrR family transcriptional regulator